MASTLDKIPLRAPDGYNVIVETPRGSRTKFAYDPETGLFRAKKLLAMGSRFPSHSASFRRRVARTSILWMSCL
jgi:inorganic pyrophosphatase